MLAQELTPTYKRLHRYLVEVVKIKTEAFSFSDMNGRANGSFFSDDIYQKNIDSNEQGLKRINFDFDKQLTEVVVMNEYVIHLKFKEFSSDLQRLMAHLVYWLSQEDQVSQFDYRVQWNNETTVDIDVVFDVKEGIILNNNGMSVC